MRKQQKFEIPKKTHFQGLCGKKTESHRKISPNPPNVRGGPQMLARLHGGAKMIAKQELSRRKVCAFLVCALFASMQCIRPAMTCAVRAVGRARILPVSSPFKSAAFFEAGAVINTRVMRLAWTQHAGFAKKSGGKGDTTAESPKAVVGAGGGKTSSLKAGSKNAQIDNVNTEDAMQAIVAVMKCVHSFCVISRRISRKPLLMSSGLTSLPSRLAKPTPGF